ncbi:DUF7483 domain-containing protein [Azospirillum soli]|uniref:DUF7483 domain-containing protein n=1 Tax=Azospirillum soli TaxID=1304799 RepID=UPI001AEB3D51|nr:hypothetical protein [Azospirillum soli]MBP2315299.1 hypothetical protein [Azospirillum soli]
MSMMLAGLMEEEFALVGGGKLYVDDVFGASAYVGNGGTMTVLNGLNMAARGWMTWTKSRTTTHGHAVMSDLIGNGSYLTTPSAAGPATNGNTFSTDANGMVLGPWNGFNAANQKFINWTFLEAPKFFARKLVSHTTGTNTTIDLTDLGVVGCAIVKRVDAVGDWWVWHRSAPNHLLYLNLPNAVVSSTTLAVSRTTLTLNSASPTGQYLVLGFAHDTSPDGMIQCDYYSSTAPINLGWEPQFMLLKTSTVADNWYIADQVRGWTADGSWTSLQPNTNNTEAAGSNFSPNASGFTPASNTSNLPVIYVAIRRPNKPALQLGADKVFCPVVRTGNGGATNITTPGFPADMVYVNYRDSAQARAVVSRLRGGGKYLQTESINAEGSAIFLNFDQMSGYQIASNVHNGVGYSLIDYAFKRAPDYFDEVCYTGTGFARPIRHNLGSAPGMMWIKRRDADQGINWLVYHKALGSPFSLSLNTTAAPTGPSTDHLNATDPTASNFTVGTGAATNFSGGKYTAFLFGDTPGLCKAGSFTLGAAPWTETCGLNPRLVILKRTDAVGDWYVWDTARGIVAGNDPYFLLNSTAAEVTSTNHIDPATNGFIINPTLPAGSYVYWACA